MPRWITWCLVAVLLVGWGLSIRQWDADGLWYDEVWSVYNAGGPPDGPLSPAEISHRLATEDPDQGLAYPLILAAWGSMVGWTPFAGRALSAFAGLLTAALVARLGRRLDQPLAGLAAAAVLLLSPFFIYYTHELRVFTIVSLSVAGLLWTYLDLMSGRRGLSLIGFVVAGLGLLYTHYFAATLLITVGLMHVIYGLSRVLRAEWSLSLRDKGLRQWLLVSVLFGVVGLLFVPWLPVFMQSLQRTATRDDVHAKSLASPDLLEHIAYYLGSGAALLTVVLLLLALYAAWRRSGWLRWMVITALVGVGVVTGFNAVLQIIEPGRVRYLIVLWPPVALVMGIGAASVSHVLTRWPRAGQIGSAVLVLGLALNGVRANLDAASVQRMEQKWTPPWQQMSRLIQREGGPQDLFLFYAGEDHYRHFYPFTFVTRGLPLKAPAAISESLADPTYGAGMQAQVESADRIWYGIDKEEAARPVFATMQTLLQPFVLCETPIDTERFSFALYARSMALCPQAPQITYGEGLALTNLGLTQEPESLTVEMLWQVGAGFTGETSVSVQVLDESGHPVAQQDVGLPAGPVGVLRVTLDAASVPVGRYSVALIVYRWQTGERLTGDRTASGETGQVMSIGEYIRSAP